MTPYAVCYCLLHERVLVDAHVGYIWGREQHIIHLRIEKTWTDVAFWVTRSLIQSLVCHQSIIDGRRFNLLSKFWQWQITWMMAAAETFMPQLTVLSVLTCLLQGSANTSSGPRVKRKKRNVPNILNESHWHHYFYTSARSYLCCLELVVMSIFVIKGTFGKLTA